MKGKKFLVTGGSRGIGKEIAWYLASRGAAVAIGYQYSKQNALELADKIYKKFGTDVLAVGASMEDQASLQTMFNAIESSWGELDGLVLGAASGNRKKLIDQTTEDWNRITAINVLGQIHCIKLGLKLFKNYGRVVLLSSEGARFGIPHYGAIGVTKAALEGTIRQLTVELADEEISINGVSATLVRTQALDSVTHGSMDVFKDEYFIEPNDIALLVAYLLGPECPNSLKGQVLRLDNGTTSQFVPHFKSNLRPEDFHVN